MLDIDSILQKLEAGSINAAEARKLFSLYAIEEIEDYAKIDIDRGTRKGTPEIVFAESKKIHETKEIVKRILEKNGSVLVSRIRDSDYDAIVSYARDELSAHVTSGRNSTTVLFSTDGKNAAPTDGGTVGILAAGTSDVGVAEEARIVCQAMGCRCIVQYDVGVAGMQRVFPMLKRMVSEGADCIIVVAGMEGALATLVSSLVDMPVIGVPTSVGYGYGEKGIGALASMLQSCSLGMAVVNIDGGVAAGGMAASIANRCVRKAATQVKK